MSRAIKNTTIILFATILIALLFSFICIDAYAITPEDLKKGDVIKMGSTENSNLKGDPYWLVMDTDGSNGILLVSAGIWRISGFNNNDYAFWNDSYAKSWCEQLYDEVFDEKEKGFVQPVDISDAEYLVIPDDPTFDDVLYPELVSEDNKVFFLSAEEAYTKFENDSARKPLITGTDFWTTGGWWLRSVYKESWEEGYEWATGVVRERGRLSYQFEQSGRYGARPAFYADFSSVGFIEKHDEALNLDYYDIATVISIPSPEEELTYSGDNQLLLETDEGYSINGVSNGGTVDANGNAVAKEAGAYSISISLEDGYIWEDDTTGDKTVECEIKQADNKVTAPVINGWAYGSKASTPSGSVSTYGTPKYKYSSSKNGKYTTAVPTKVGTYYCRAEVTGTKNYAGAVSAPTAFKIRQPDNFAFIAAMKSSGSNKFEISWMKYSNAQGYDIFFARCNHSGKNVACKKVKTIKGNKTFKWTKSGLKKNTAYKAYVKAYVMKNGKKQYVKTSPTIHAYTSGGDKKFTNPKSVSVKKAAVSLKKGKTYKISGSVKLLQKKKKIIATSHAPKLRYLSSNTGIATVNKAGKIIAKKAGICTVYAYSANGVSKAVKVTVK